MSGCEEYFALLQVGTEADAPAGFGIFELCEEATDTRETDKQEEGGEEAGRHLRASSPFCRQIVDAGVRGGGVHAAHPSSRALSSLFIAGSACRRGCEA